MVPIKSEGFVLKKINFRETSVILTIFTKEMGKIKGILKGVRKENSKISPLVFTQGAYIFTLIYRKRNELNLLSSPSLIDFYTFKNKKNLQIWHILLNLINLFTPENQKEEKIFYLIKETGEILKNFSDGSIFFIGFKIKFIQILGFGLKLDRCVVCEKMDRDYFFSGRKGGIICKACMEDDLNSTRISKKILSIMRFIQKTDLKNLKTLKIKKEELKKINSFCNLVLYYHLNLDFIWWENEKIIFQ